MSPAHKKKTVKKQPESKSSGKKKSTARRVKEVRLDAFRHGANTVLLSTILIVFVVFLGLAWRIFGIRLPAPRPANKTACLELYYYDQALAYLVPIHRRVTLAPADSRSERAVHEFASVPRDPSLARIYPANIQPPEVRVANGIATVDLPEEIRTYWQNSGKDREAQFLDALTLTVTSAGESSKVRYLIAGQPLETSPGGIALDKPIETPAHINEVPNPGLGDDAIWTTAYFLDSSGKYLFPLAIQIAANADPAMEAVKALLVSPPRAVDPPPRAVIEPGCSLDRLLIENGVAKVVLRVPDPQMIFLRDDINVFRRALFLTLKQCCNAQNVTIELNGRPLESYSRFGNLADLSQDNCSNLEPDYQPIPPTGIQPSSSKPEGQL